MKKYVLGFCFLEDRRCVAILRTKDDWQKGLVNGIGGTVKDGEFPLDAMVREFQEETGALTKRKHWQLGVVLRGENWVMHVFRGFLQYTPPLNPECEEGQIILIGDESIPENMERTARWLYWYCRDDSTFGLLNDG